MQVDATYTVSGHVTTNIHTFRVDASDNNGVYRCEASSIMTKEPIAASVKLKVHCEYLDQTFIVLYLPNCNFNE